MIVFNTQDEFENAVMQVLFKRFGITTQLNNSHGCITLDVELYDAESCDTICDAYDYVALENT